MFGATICAAERWQAIKVTNFERRQMAALREELNLEYEPQNRLGKIASTKANPKKNIQRESDLTHLCGKNCAKK